MLDHTPSIKEIKKLNNKIFALLSDAELSVLDFYRKRGRKYGVSVTIENSNLNELSKAMSEEHADAILKNSNSRVFIKVQQQNNI